jgi:sec-independent protein translocase protein TatC
MLKFKAHFYELKLKFYYYSLSIFVSFFISFFFSPNLISILSYPFLKFVKTNDSDFIFTSIFEIFTTYYTLSFYICFFFNIPLGLYFILVFIKSGLFKYEKEIFFFFFKSFIYLISFSFLFTYYVIFPVLLVFLLNLDLITNTDFLFIKMETKIYEYIIFFCKSLFFYCFIFFQIPLIFLVFSYFKQPALQYMIDKRRIWIFLSLTVGCLFSSPDLLSLFVISIPFILFFEMFTFFLILKLNYKRYIDSFSRELLER